MKTIYMLLTLSLILAGSCSTAADADKYTVIAAPVIGAYSGNDLPDHDCSLVLVEVSRRSNGTGGYLDDGHSWIWFGQVDVADTVLENGGIPKVAFHAGSAESWYEADCLPVTGAVAGFQRCEFQLDTITPGPGMSGTAITQSVIELIPFIHLPGGDRLFDHNRNNGDFDNYLLTVDNVWSIASEAGLCSLTATSGSSEALSTPSQSSVTFNGDFTTSVEGKLVSGASFSLIYELDRLPNCRGTHNGYPAWDIRAFVRFLPGGEVVEGSVRDFVSDMGYPTNEAFSRPLSIEIPAGATSMEVWFSNTTLGGASCQEWDSNYGQNYAIPVQAGPGWVGGWFLNISRASSVPCADGSSLGDNFTYGTWARQRSEVGNVCFQVWQEGVTDYQNADLWQELDVRMWYRFGADAFDFEYVDFVDYVGNNARYAFNIAALDPFRPYNCPDVETSEVTYSTGESYEIAELEFFVTVNGVISGLQTSEPLTGTYEDYADNWFRDTNCQ